MAKRSEYFTDYIAPHLDDIIKRYESGEEISSVLRFYGIDYDQFASRKLITDESRLKHLYSNKIEYRFGDVLQWLSMGKSLIDICFELEITKTDFYNMMDVIPELKQICIETNRLEDNGEINCENSNDILYETIIKDNWNTIREMLLEGKDVESICHKFKITTRIWYSLINNYPSFRDMVENCNIDVLKIKLDDALTKSATGYYYTESKETIKENLRTGEIIKTTERVRKYQAPNAQSIMLCQANIAQNDNWVYSDRLSADIKRRDMKLKEDNNW